MAICTYCGEDMEVVENCSWTENHLIEFPNGESLVALTDHFDELSGHCHDCNIIHGNFHHPGCDVERCPKCGGQLITCGCLEQ